MFLKYVFKDQFDQNVKKIMCTFIGFEIDFVLKAILVRFLRSFIT